MQTKSKFDKKSFINFFKGLGININTHTKARGNQGILLKNRIDISKKLDEERQVQVMAHEFAHYIHSKIEPDMNKTQGHLEKIFCTSYTEEIEEELKELTLNVDENAKMKILKSTKNEVIEKIKEQELIIKANFPLFKKSERFVEFEKYIKNSKAKYLLKHDRVKYITPFLRRTELYSIDMLEKDFPTMPDAFCAYIRMNSLQKKRARISARIRKYQKYYDAPNELFARFVESFFIDPKISLRIAPISRKIFCDLLEKGYYYELKDLFIIAGLYKQ